MTEEEKIEMYKSLCNGYKWERRKLYGDIPCGDGGIQCRLRVGEWENFNLGDQFLDDYEYKKSEWYVHLPMKNDWYSYNNFTDGNYLFADTKEECEKWINNKSWLNKFIVENKKYIFGLKPLPLVKFLVWNTCETVMNFVLEKTIKYGDIGEETAHVIRCELKKEIEKELGIKL